MAEPFYRRWPRRALTVTLMVSFALLSWTLAPVWLLLLGGLDLASGRRWARVRSMTCLAVFTATGTVGLVAATFTWVWTVGRPRARLALDYAIQERWAKTLDGMLQRIYGFERDVEWVGLRPDPARSLIVLERHTGVVDTLLPIRLLCPEFRLRYVMKQELLWDPCLDVVGSRMPNAFVARGGGREDTELVSDLARDLPPGVGVMIFPEGTRASDARRRHVLERLREKDDPRAALAAQLQHLLPPRPGGIRALREVAPQADVLILGHAGYDRVMTLGDLWQGSLIGTRILVRAEGFPAAEVPRDPDAFAAWVDARWLELDRWVEAVDPRDPSAASSPAGRASTGDL